MNIKVDNKNLDDIVKEWNKLKQEKTRLSDVVAKQSEQLRAQGRQLNRLKKDNDRYRKILTAQHMGSHAEYVVLKLIASDEVEEN